MKRFLLIVTAMVSALVFCGTASGNDSNGHQFDDRRFNVHRDDFRPLDSPFDFYRDGFRPLDSPFDFYRDDFRRFDYYQDDLPFRLNDYCFHHAHT